jgi:hypothetical protein
MAGDIGIFCSTISFQNILQLLRQIKFTGEHKNKLKNSWFYGIKVYWANL